MKRLILSAVVCAFMTVSAMADLIQNGSFENGVTVTLGNFLELDSGSTAINNWAVVGSPLKAIDYINGYWEAADGTRSLDLNGRPGPGGVEQTFNTTPGQSYRVTFDMAGNPGGLPNIYAMTMDVSATGSGSPQTASFQFDTTGHSISAMGWQPEQFVFTADAPSTTLQFMSTTSIVGNLGYGPALDNVSVVPVPLPGAILLGLLGLSAAGAKLRKFV